MTISHKASRPEAAPALFRLLSDSALSRAALGACGFPVALLDASAKGRPFSSLLLAQHEGGELVYKGNVGTGFNTDTLRDLARKMKRLEMKGWEAAVESGRTEPG